MRANIHIGGVPHRLLLGQSQKERPRFAFKERAQPVSVIDLIRLAVGDVVLDRLDGAFVCRPRYGGFPRPD